MAYPIEKITALIGAHRYGTEEADISFLLTDSRSLCFPEQTMFFALRTERKDGHDFIAGLYSRGVRNFCIDHLPDGYWNGDFRGANFLKVTSPLKALQRLAERHRDEFDIPVVGITGSNGKTIVKEWLNRLFCPDKRTTRSPRSYNSQTGVPLSVWLMQPDTEMALFEAGISQPGEMAALACIIQPTIGVITNLGQAHQENFSSMEQKCSEKLRLFDSAKMLIYPADDEVISQTVKRELRKVELIGWSMKSADAAMYIAKATKTDGRTDVEYTYMGTKGSFSIPFIDDASVANAVTCATVALRMGMDRQVLASRISQLEPVRMRLEVKEGRHGLTLINDSYNSDINSLDIALDFMCRRPDHGDRSHTLILSDILQSGMAASELYKKVSEMMAAHGVDKIIGIGPEISANSKVINARHKAFFDNTSDFIASDVFASLRNEVLLIKGARKFRFEQITDLIVEKVHETTLEVNLRALSANLDYYRSKKSPSTRLVCMIKADAYGAGSAEVAKTLQDGGVDYLAVAVADEGVTLRRNGITAGIMVMNPEMNSFHTLFERRLEPEVYSFRLLDALVAAAEREGVTNFPVHLKLDTGMHRLGFDPVNDIDKLIERLKNQHSIVPRSVFTHFVGADSSEFDEFSARQFSLFTVATDKLQAAFDFKILRHICNSAGMEHFPQYQLDMCRLGIGLYGVNPLNNGIMNNVSTLKTTILQLRHLKQGETVGYSRRGQIERDSLIATIPIGYADGLNRKLGNGHCYCIVNGQKARYVGNICMDVAMIDVTGIPCEEGDTVEIFGDHLPVTVLSDAIGTIPYEVLTSVSPRVKRVYFSE